MPPPSRWTRSPTWPSAMASAKSASGMSRTWYCRMSHNAICRSFGASSLQPALATPNVGLVSDIIACPGLDYCSLANARSIPVAQELTRRFSDHALAQHHRPPAHQHFRLHQCLRPPPCRPHRHSRRREERRGVLPDHARRPRRREGQARDAARARRCPTTKSPTWSRTWSRPMSSCASGRTNCSSTPSSASASSHSRSVSMPLVKSGRIVADRFRAHRSTTRRCRRMCRSS